MEAQIFLITYRRKNMIITGRYFRHSTRGGPHLVDPTKVIFICGYIQEICPKYATQISL